MLTRVLIDLIHKRDIHQMQIIGELLEHLYGTATNIPSDSGVLGEIGTTKEYIAEFINRYINIEFHPSNK